MCNLIAEFDSETEDGKLSSGTYTLKQNLPGIYSNTKAYIHPHVTLDQSQPQVTVAFFTHLNLHLLENNFSIFITAAYVKITRRCRKCVKRDGN